MSEPPPPETMAEDPAGDPNQEEQKPQLSSDAVLNALRQLQSTPTTTPTIPQPTEQLDNDTKTEPTPPTPPPQSEWDGLRAQLRDRPIDADGWLKLVSLAEDSGDMEKIKQTYEGMLETYPNTVSICRYPVHSCFV